jgi:hypothetical protein
MDGGKWLKQKEVVIWGSVLGSLESVQPLITLPWERIDLNGELGDD